MFEVGAQIYLSGLYVALTIWISWLLFEYAKFRKDPTKYWTVMLIHSDKLEGKIKWYS